MRDNRGDDIGDHDITGHDISGHEVAGRDETERAAAGGQGAVSEAFYDLLAKFHERPAPFSRGSTRFLWTDDHTSRHMLAAHLDPAHDRASRRPEKIVATVEWIDHEAALAGRSVLDLGCGPGLYAAAMAERGAHVTGLDLSRRALTHARKAAARAGHSISYHQADYLADPLPGEQNLALLIYGDIGVLAPDARQTLLGKVKAALKPGGRFIFDVFSSGQFAARRETGEFAHNLMGGLFAEEGYGFSRVFLWPETMLALDRYLVVAPDRVIEVFNWCQHFTPATITAELMEAGFGVEKVVDAITGAPWTDDAAEREFAVVASVG